MVKEKKKEKKSFSIHKLFLGIAFLTFISYLVIEILHFDSFLNFIPKLLGMVLILLLIIKHLEPKNNFEFKTAYSNSEDIYLFAYLFTYLFWFPKIYSILLILILRSSS